MPLFRNILVGIDLSHFDHATLQPTPAGRSNDRQHGGADFAGVVLLAADRQTEGFRFPGEVVTQFSVFSPPLPFRYTEHGKLNTEN